MLGVRLYAALSIAPRVRLALRVKCFFSVCSYDYGVQFGTNGNVRSSFSSYRIEV